MTDGNLTRHMTKSEATECHRMILHHAGELGRHLTEMKQRQGYKALGFETFTAYLQSGDFHQARATLYRAMQHHELNQQPHMQGLKPAQQRVLNQYPAEHQPTIRQLAQRAAGEKSVTAGMIQNAGEIVMQAINTGAVDDADGNPLLVSLSAAERERKARQRDHINQSQGIEFVTSREGRMMQINGRDCVVLPVELSEIQRLAGGRILVSVSVQREARRAAA